MPNNHQKNNNGKKGVELLPEELRRSEEKRKKEEKPEIKLFVPPEEEKAKTKGPTFLDKFFGALKERVKRRRAEEVYRIAEAPKQQGAKEQPEILKMKIEGKPQKILTEAQPRRPSPLPSPPPRPTPSPPPAPSVSKEAKKEIKPVAQILPGVKPLGPKEKILPRKKLGITLMPAELVAPAEVKRTKQTIILVVVILILSVIFLSGIGILKLYEGKLAAEIKKVEADLATVDQQIKNLEEKKNQAQTLQKQIKSLDILLDQHIYWTNIFSFLEKNTIADVYFLNLVGQSDGSITMSAVAKSYKAMAKQIVAFREDEQTDKVFITSASASVLPTGEVSEINFDAKLKLKPQIFLK